MAIIAILCYQWQITQQDKEDLPMQSMNISLPDPLKQFVDGQIAKSPKAVIAVPASIVVVK